MKNEKVIEWFNDCECAFYQISASRTSKMYWNDSEPDNDLAAEKLGDHLQKLPAGTYTIKVFKTAKSTTPYGEYKFKVEPEYQERAQFAGAGAGVPNFMLLDEIRGLKSEVLNLKTEIELSNEIAESEPENNPPPFSIGSLLEKPEIQSVLIGLVSKFFNPPPPVAIAGIGVDDEILQAAMVPVSKLLENGVTVNDLNILASKTDRQLKTLLMMLRNGF